MQRRNFDGIPCKRLPAVLPIGACLVSILRPSNAAWVDDTSAMSGTANVKRYDDLLQRVGLSQVVSAL